MCAKSLQSCLTLCDPVDCSPPGSSVHGILQARILEWVAMPFSRGSFRSRDGAQVSWVSCIGRCVLLPPQRISACLGAGLFKNPSCMQDLSSLIRDGTYAPLQWKFRVLTTGPRGKSPQRELLGRCWKWYITFLNLACVILCIFVLLVYLNIQKTALPIRSTPEFLVYLGFTPWAPGPPWLHPMGSWSTLASSHAQGCPLVLVSDVSFPS